MSRNGRSLHVSNLGNRIRSDDLHDVFEKFGKIRDIYIPLDFYTRQPRGFAYVQFQDDRDAEDAMRELDGTRLLEREITIAWAAGDRKTPGQMRNKEVRSRRGYSRSPRRRSRSPRRRSRSRSRSRGRYSSRRSRSRSRSRDRRRDYSRERSRSRDRSRERGRERSRSRERSPVRSPVRDASPKRSPSPQERRRSPSPDRRSRSRSRSPAREQADEKWDDGNGGDE
eukprot:Colp12_sorted_trinity150504_noHs@10401